MIIWIKIYRLGTSYIYDSLIFYTISTPPQKEGREYIQLAEGLATTQLTQWMFVGPFRDDHFTARSRTLGPEVGDVDYNRTYDDGSGVVLRWQPADVHAQGGVAPTPVRMPPAVAASSYNRTVAVVLCTHVIVQIPQGGKADATNAANDIGSKTTNAVEVILTGSTSAVAEIRLGDSIILFDRLTTGPMLREFSRKVSLVPGQWTPLRVKAMQMSWSAPWGMALSMHGDGMRGVPGLRSRH